MLKKYPSNNKRKRGTMDTYHIKWGEAVGEYILIRLFDKSRSPIGGPLKIPSDSALDVAEKKVIDLDWASKGSLFYHEGNCPEP